ncbi:MAG TPA: RICIN domain-containing protein, partial [Spirochaetota bacterium]|nr:RICIN domain-containing protein [Spirochaetota bacterium]
MRKTLLILLCATICVVAGSVPAPAVEADKYYYIKSVISGDEDRGYWDLPGENPRFKKGAELTLYKYDTGDDRKFMITPAGNGWFYISPKNATFGRAFRGNVDVSDVANGGKVHIWDIKLAKNANQQFKFVDVGGGKYKIIVNHGGGTKVLCAAGRSDADGTRVVAWDDHETDAVLWRFIEAGRAGLLNQAGGAVKDKVEVTGGWDRYLYSYGDTSVPDMERWTAIRSTQKKSGNDFGNFWDIPGDGALARGNGKKIQLWEMEYKFQKSPESDRRYMFEPLWEKTRKIEDTGYYLLKCDTGTYVKTTASVKLSPGDDSVPNYPVYIKSAQSGDSAKGFWDQPGPSDAFRFNDPIGIYSIDEGKDQQFRFVSAGDGWYNIVSLNGGYVTVSNNENADGVRITVFIKAGNEAQKFRVKRLASGRWKIYTYWGRALCTPQSAE